MSAMNQNLSVLMITSEFPTPERPNRVPFISRQVEYLRRAGIDVDVFYFRGAKKLSNYQDAWVRLRKHTSGKRYDLVHAQWGQSALLAMPKRLPLVITFRGSDLEGIISKDGKLTFHGHVQKWVSKAMSRVADEVIVVSESLAANFSRRDYTVIPSGLDLEMFRPMPSGDARKLLGLPSGVKLVLFAASSTENPRKRYGLAKEAIQHLPSKINAELVVASNVPHTAIPYYMNACDALLLTSVHEGSPNVVKEALACNLPVVSVDVGDVRTRLNGIEGCFVCTEAQPKALAECLERVLASDVRIAGREKVAELNEERIAAKVIEVYWTAVQKRSVMKQTLQGPEAEIGSISRV